MLETTPLLVGFFDVVRAVLELLGVLAIVVGAVMALVILVRPMLTHERVSVTASRYELSRYLALGLEFQLSADIVGTAIAPSWTAIGRVAAIVVIRSTLNYFLTREVTEERERLASVSPNAMSEAPLRPDPVNPDE
jgi:uncharacterized membrane protein